MKVLWIDDEFDTLEIINESAAENDIELIGIKSAEDALRELERPDKYDAVVLDGLFYLDNSEKGTPSKDTAFGKVAMKLRALKEKEIILPWFILSGKTHFTKDANSMVETMADKDYASGKVFDKKNREELLLWIEIKKSVEDIPKYKIKQEFHRAFEVCSEKYIGIESQKYLLDILTSVKNPSAVFDDNLYFTQIRIIIEAMFRAANRFGLLHDACITKDGKVNLTESSLFLAGLETKHLNVKCAISHFPKLIADSVQSILFITGAASHTTDPEIKNNINLSQYRSIIRTPYLLYSLTFQLMDVLVWFKEYVGLNSDIKQNKLYWKEMGIQRVVISEVNNLEAKKNIGIIEQDNQGNFYCNEFILNYNYTLNNYKIGDKIEIIESKNNEKSNTSFYYPRYATKFKKI